MNIVTVPTVRELNSTAAQDGTVVLALGNSLIGDKKDAIYRYDATSNALVDGISVIEGFETKGRWIRLGLVGDISDIIQNAYDRLNGITELIEEYEETLSNLPLFVSKVQQLETTVTSIGTQFGSVLSGFTSLTTEVGMFEQRISSLEGEITNKQDSLPAGNNGTFLANDLTFKKVSYNSLTDLPNLFSGQYGDLSGKPDLFSGNYNDLQNLPALFSGDYGDLQNKPDLFSGSYDDLRDKPAGYSLPAKLDTLNTSNTWGDTLLVGGILGFTSTGVYDIGSSSARFKKAWGLETDVTSGYNNRVFTNFLRSRNNNLTLENSTGTRLGILFENGNFLLGSANTDTGVKFTVFGDSQLNGNILPDTNGAYNIGSATSRYNQIYVGDRIVSSQVYAQIFRSGNATGFTFYNVGATRVLSILDNGNTIIGSGAVDTGYRLTVEGATNIGGTLLAGRLQISGNNISLASSNYFTAFVPSVNLELANVATDGTAYENAMVVRGRFNPNDTIPKRISYLLKLSSEGTESKKMGGMMLESLNTYANSPNLFFLTDNEKRVSILSGGNTRFYGSTFTTSNALQYIELTSNDINFARADGTSYVTQVGNQALVLRVMSGATTSNQFTLFPSGTSQFSGAVQFPTWRLSSATFGSNIRNSGGTAIVTTFFDNGNVRVGDSSVDNGYKLSADGSLYIAGQIVTPGDVTSSGHVKGNAFRSNGTNLNFRSGVNAVIATMFENGNIRFGTDAVDTGFKVQFDGNARFTGQAVFQDNSGNAYISLAGVALTKYSGQSVRVAAATEIADGLYVGTLTNNINLDSKAIFQVDSSTRGVLLPRHSTTQMNAVVSPPNGLTVFNTDILRYCVRTGSVWSNLAVESGSRDITITDQTKGFIIRDRGDGTLKRIVVTNNVISLETAT